MGRVVKDYDLSKNPLPEKFVGCLVSVCANPGNTITPVLFSFSHNATVYTYHPSSMLRAYDLSSVSGVIPYQEAILRKATGDTFYFFYTRYMFDNSMDLAAAVIFAHSEGSLKKRRPRGYSPQGKDIHDTQFSNKPGAPMEDSDDLMHLLGLDGETPITHPAAHAPHAAGPATDPPEMRSRDENINTRAPHRALGLRLRAPAEYLATLKK